MNGPTNKQDQQEIEKVFDQVRQLSPEASPYLETRVLAQWQGRQPRLSLSFWKRFALGSSALSVMLLAVAVWLLLKPTTYAAFVDQQFAVHIELKDLDQSRIAKSRIELPDGVFFEVVNLPELKNQRSLTLRWTRRAIGQDFPIVLSASEAGMKTVRVQFLDENDSVVAVRTFRINLQTPKQSS